jgi:hypothetical protein
MVKRHQAGFIAVLSVLIFVTGCWKQQDFISIKPDGMTAFRSEVTIMEMGFSVRDIDQLSQEFMKQLVKAGWKVEKKWVSKSEPYKLTFFGEGNIRTVKSAPDFYVIQKMNDKTFAIRFVPVEYEKGKSSRSIRFERGFFDSRPRILDERGSEVKNIDNALRSTMYKIVF